MADTERPDPEAVDSRFDPIRKIVGLSGDQSLPVNLARFQRGSRDEHVVRRAFVEPLSSHYDLVAVTPEAPVRNLALGAPRRRLHVSDSGRKRYFAAVVLQGDGQIQPTVYRAPGHKILEHLSMVDVARLQRKWFRWVLA